MKNWSEIRKASETAGFFHGWMSAEENAAETIHVEKAANPEDFDKLALASLCDALANGSLDENEHNFFVKIGVEF
jgi:hypothetical protein